MSVRNICTIKISINFDTTLLKQIQQKNEKHFFTKLQYNFNRKKTIYQELLSYFYKNISTVKYIYNICIFTFFHLYTHIYTFVKN